MCNEIEEHIAAVEALYAPLITGENSRLERGSNLWKQFTDAVSSYRKHNKASFTPVYERINELAVARALLIDPSLADCSILYEPPLTKDGRRIDFVVPEAEGRNLYIEVKTIRPTAMDNDENWNKYKEKQNLHTKNVKYIVDKEMMGSSLYTNSFSARSKFMGYVREFEPRLIEANAVQPGRGLLVFCGTGMEWHRSELEDFADFYRTGKHRQDDPFAAMEANNLQSHKALTRNIAAFGFLKRPMNSEVGEEWVANVRGPVLFP